MAQIYVSDETKDLLELAAKEDQRTQDGEINFLLKKRLKELNIPESASDPSVEPEQEAAGSTPACW